MKEPSMNEREYRRFLLGEMAAGERDEFERKFIEEAEIFDELRVAEDELIEDYVRGGLSRREKEKFEQNFLTTPQRRERIAFMREMITRLSSETAFKKHVSDETTAPFWTNILNSLRRPQWAFGLGLLILLFLFGLWFLRSPNDRKTDELVKITPTPQTSPTATISPTVETNENSALPKNKPDERPAPEERNVNNRQNLNADQAPKTPVPAKPTTVTLALFTGSVRSGGKTNEIALPKDANGVNLQINLPENDYQSYRAEVLDQNGRPVFRSGKLSAKGLRVNAFVPARNLSRGDFIVKLYGQNPNAPEESVADYQFRVNIN